jgi:putative cell wall-binding protein
MISDCKLHKCHGVMIVGESSIISEPVFKKLQEAGISIVRLKPDSGSDGDYQTR